MGKYFDETMESLDRTQEHSSRNGDRLLEAGYLRTVAILLARIADILEERLPMPHAESSQEAAKSRQRAAEARERYIDLFRKHGETYIACLGDEVVAIDRDRVRIGRTVRSMGLGGQAVISWIEDPDVERIG